MHLWSLLCNPSPFPQLTLRLYPPAPPVPTTQSSYPPLMLERKRNSGSGWWEKQNFLNSYPVTVTERKRDARKQEMVHTSEKGLQDIKSVTNY